MFVYSVPTKAVAENFATHATPNTEIDAIFVKPGARNIWFHQLMVLGKAAGLTALSGIAYRLKRWTTTGSSAGTAVTPIVADPGNQAAKATAGAASAGVTSGTGGPSMFGFCGSGVSGPGGVVAQDIDDPGVVEGSANQSMDLFVVSPTASLNYEALLKFKE